MKCEVVTKKVGHFVADFSCVEYADAFIASFPEDMRDSYEIRGKPSPVFHVNDAEDGLHITQDSRTHALVASLTLLVQAIGEQTQAINRLADSNRDLVKAMAEDSGMDGDDEPKGYLNAR